MTEIGELPERRPSFKFMSGFVIVFVIIAIVVVYFLSGFFFVGPAEVGLVKRFGAHIKTVGPGLHYHLPYPIESVVKVNVSALRKQEIGFRTVSPGRYTSVKNESLMLTGDGNIVSVEAVVQYYVKDPEQFAFNLINDEQVVRFVSEAILREEVAAASIDEVLTFERDVIAAKTAERVQDVLDQLNVGIEVKNVYLQEVSPPEQVVAAFDDVNNAKQDKEKLRNEAERYKNDLIPRAEGEAVQIVREAEAYAEELILKAKGEAERFTKVFGEYKKAPKITRTRLYLEMLNRILKDSEKFVLLSEDGVLKFLDLSKMEEGGSR